MGENHTASVIFPPPAHTIQGALRTAVLREYDLHPADYNHGNYAEDHPVVSAIGRSGEESPFQVVGPFSGGVSDYGFPVPIIGLRKRKITRPWRA